MSIWDDAGWVATGGYYAIQGAAGNYRQNKKAREMAAIVDALTDRELEKKLRDEVYNATPEIFDKIWCRIEEYKRDNPERIIKHLWSSYWMHVGKERFPITYVGLCAQLGKTKLNKSDEKMLAMYRGWTVTLLMNTYGKYSNMEATRVAFKQVNGSINGVGWTREYG